VQGFDSGKRSPPAFALPAKIGGNDSDDHSLGVNPVPGSKRDSSNGASDNSRLVASAIEGGVWFGVSTWKKLAIVLCVLGFGALALAVAGLAPGRLFWAVTGFAAFLVGVVLAYVPRTTDSKPYGDGSADID
jgi:hypothetical protein